MVTDLYIAGNGNVGIGTTEPNAKLHVEGGDEPFRVANNGYYFFAGANRAGGDYVEVGAIKNNGTAWANLVLNRDGGHVGIGTTEPTHPLHLKAGWSLVALDTNAAGQDSGIRLMEAGTVKWHIWNAAGGATLRIQRDGASFSALAIDQNSNVGIGTTDPKANLDVSGSIALMGKQAIHGYDSWLRLNEGNAFTSGVHTPKLFFPGSLNVGGRKNGEDPEWGNAWFSGSITYDGQLNKLDVTEGDGHARIRAHDLWLGHSRHGLKNNTGDILGRALVDGLEKFGGTVFEGEKWLKTLIINYARDWDAVVIDGRVDTRSSRKLKEHIQVLSGETAKSIVSALEPVTYLYKNDRFMSPCLGFIAEDSPTEVVSPTRESITFNHIVAALTRVVKDQVQSISELQAQVNSLSDKAAKAGAS